MIGNEEYVYCKSSFPRKVNQRWRDVRIEKDAERRRVMKKKEAVQRRVIEKERRKEAKRRKVTKKERK